MRVIAAPIEQICYGPIAEKELRVLSRLKRYYVMRCLYIVALALVTLAYWGTLMRIRAGNVTMANAQMGAALAPGYIWLQFFASQLVVIILLSNAINGEIGKRSLGELMSTPLTGVHIVWGKLFSRLVPAILILSIGFPLLALLRLFGGISWEVVVASLSVTLTAMVFSAALTLLVSIFVHQPFSVVSRVIALQAIWLLIPIVQSVSGMSLLPPFMTSVFTYTTPHTVLSATSSELGIVGIAWPWHCAIMLAGSLLLGVASAISVRRIGMRQALGERIYRRPGEKRKKAEQTRSPRQTDISRVMDPALIWKEIRVGYLSIGLWQRRVLVLGSFALLCVLYGFCMWFDVLANTATHTAIITGLTLLGLLRVSITCAMSIPRERETQTWPALLATPQTDWEILVGKGLGSLCLTSPVWLVLAGHIGFFVVAGDIHLLAPLLIVSVAFGAVLMVGAWGLYVGSLCKRASTAASVVVIVFILATVNFCCPVPTFLVSPLFLMGAMVATLSGPQATARSISGIGDADAMYAIGGLHPFLILMLIVLIYLVVAWVCLACAKGNIRRRIFPDH